MTISTDLRWRTIVLTFLYDVNVNVVSTVLGVSVRSIERWYKLFKENGNVLPKQRSATSARWPSKCIAFVEGYVQSHPYFYLEELQEVVRKRFPSLRTTSTSTIC